MKTRNALVVSALFFLMAALLQACVSAPSESAAPAGKESAVEPVSAACPRVDLGETLRDCPWAGIARSLSGKATPELLSAEASPISAQLQQDARNAALKALWGESINFDELARAEIVDEKILTSIASLFGASVSGQIAHAGMEHTYGYLFSNLKTAFGYKRARWVNDTLERGFGLPSGVLGPLPREGTLFTNVSALFGKIAFRGKGDKKEKEALMQAVQGAAPQVRDYPIDSLKITRLEETVQLGSRTVVIRTDFAQFPYPIDDEKNSVLLVYSVRDEDQSRIITGFPVEYAFMQNALDPKALGPKQLVQSRYNAHVEGLSGQKHYGHRRIIRGL